MAQQKAASASWVTDAILAFGVIGIIAATAWFSLPVAAWGPALVAALGVVYARMSSREQVRVARQKLFLDLLPRRLEWIGTLNDAALKRDREAVVMLERLLADEPMGEPQELWRLYDCGHEADWLFGPEIKPLVMAVISASALVDNARLKARQGDHQAALDVSVKAAAVHERLGEVSAAVKPYLYVGDISAPLIVPRTSKHDIAA